MNYRQSSIDSVDSISRDRGGVKVDVLTAHERQLDTELARLQTELVQLVDTTRNEIGRELHDSVQQQLTGLHLLAHELADSIKSANENGASHDETDQDEIAAKASRIARGIGLALNEIHELARGLVPSLITPDSLPAALAELAQSISQRAHIKGGRRFNTNPKLERITCRFQALATEDVADSRTATHLYRIAQEAVTNAIKHGKCSRIEILFEQCGRQFRLEVRDDGLGIDRRYLSGNGQPAAERNKLGMKSMAYRAGAIGGTLLVDRPAGGGTRVCCLVPHTAETGE
ncbi:MAG: sensor histidine kinase [Planctomycetota bacterium]